MNSLKSNFFATNLLFYPIEKAIFYYKLNFFITNMKKVMKKEKSNQKQLTFGKTVRTTRAVDNPSRSHKPPSRFRAEAPFSSNRIPIFA